MIATVKAFSGNRNFGRPAKEIDADVVRKLAKLGCTEDEIADFFRASPSIVSDRFRSDFQLGCAESKISLRRMQFKAARAGSVPILIHLGKVHLGQTGRLDVTSKGESAKLNFHMPDNSRDTEIELPYKDGEGVHLSQAVAKETDLAPPLSSPEVRHVQPDPYAHPPQQRPICAANLRQAWP